MSTVLRPCEATTYEGERLVPVLCGKPGRWWESPSGTSFVVCEHHAEVFARALPGGAFFTGDRPVQA